MSSRSHFLWLLAFGAILCIASFWCDNAVIAWVAGHSSAQVKEVARFFTQWGDFLPIVSLLLVLMIAAWLVKRPFVMRLIALMLGCAVVGGLAANVLRVLTGRARPWAKVPAGWYGLRDHGVWIAGSPGYSSFPSGHTAVAIACVAPLWVFLSPRMRVAAAAPATVMALCIAASRILLNEHHLSDVLTSVWMGVVLGTLICRRFAPWLRKAEI